MAGRGTRCRKNETVGRRILAVLMSYQFGIGMDRALKLYGGDREIDLSWDAVGAELLRHLIATGSSGLEKGGDS